MLQTANARVNKEIEIQGIERDNTITDDTGKNDTATLESAGSTVLNSRVERRVLTTEPRHSK